MIFFIFVILGNSIDLLDNFIDHHKFNEFDT